MNNDYCSVYPSRNVTRTLFYYAHNACALLVGLRQSCEIEIHVHDLEWYSYSELSSGFGILFEQIWHFR